MLFIASDYFAISTIFMKVSSKFVDESISCYFISSPLFFCRRRKTMKKHTNFENFIRKFLMFIFLMINEFFYVRNKICLASQFIW